jgi:hypothetical protein
MHETHLYSTHTLLGIRDIRVGGEPGGRVFSGELSMEISGCSEPWFYGHLGVQNFGFTVLWLVRYLGVRIPGFTVTLDLRILSATRIFGLFSDVCCGFPLRFVINNHFHHVGRGCRKGGRRVHGLLDASTCCTSRV